MAISNTVVNEGTGFTLDGAYHKIDHVLYNKDNVIDFKLHIYVSQIAKEEGKQPLLVLSFTVPYQQEMVTLPALYTYLKTLPEFANAIDC